MAASVFENLSSDNVKAKGNSVHCVTEERRERHKGVKGIVESKGRFEVTAR
jgi:hypothetical protein